MSYFVVPLTELNHNWKVDITHDPQLPEPEELQQWESTNLCLLFLMEYWR